MGFLLFFPDIGKSEGFKLDKDAIRGIIFNKIKSRNNLCALYVCIYIYNVCMYMSIYIKIDTHTYMI